MRNSNKKRDLSRVRTRYEPPTLEEAIFAAQGLTRDLDQQIAIATQLTGAPESDVRTALDKALSPTIRSTQMRSAGAHRAFTAERKVQRPSLSSAHNVGGSRSFR